MTLAPLLLVLLQTSTAATPLPTQPAAASFRSVVPVLYVRDVRRSAAFYRDVLGFELKSFIVGAAHPVKELSKTDDPYGADLSIAGQPLALQRFANVHASGTRFDIVVYDLTNYHQRITSLGAKVGGLQRSTDGKIFCFDVLDPDGHHILFLQAQEKHS